MQLKTLSKKIKLGELSKDEINKILGDAWLNINIDERKIWNPLLHIPTSCEDSPHYYFTWLMSRPEYFSFLCREMFNVNLAPIQGVVLKTMWNHKFPMMVCSRGFSKSFLLAVYSFLRMILLPGRQIVITGAAFRQSKIVFEYMENIWNNAPLLRDMCRGNRQGPFRETDRWDFRVGNSITKALPVGNGEKIRGQRANDIFVDEMKSINREIFETVISGFAAVSSSPIQAIQGKATEKLAKLLNIEIEIEDNDDTKKSNQIVMSGTCDYSFNHFAEYWRKWHLFVTSEGKPEILAPLFGDKGIPPEFSHKDYCIIRIPYDLIPDGFMDPAQLARYRASMLPETFALEFGAVFSKDSNGFFKRTVIESCVASPENSISIPDHGTVIFNPTLKGDPRCRYVFAVDPASEVDKFAIVIIELRGNHRRIVYCWTTDKKEYREKLESRLISESDFYGYCARKIRELMKVFPCAAIALDSQGGGVAVMEALHDKDKLKPGERPLWPTIVPEKPSDTDGEFGEHIIHIVNFADGNWTREANHGLKMDFMNKICLFPHVDAVEYAIAMGDDEMKNRLYDTLEDCIYDINELKDELSTIVVTVTPSGRERWDTPEIKLPGQKKGRLRKDRYSALLMANMVARTIQSEPIRQDHNYEIGWAKGGPESKDVSGPSFIGPHWASDVLNNLY